MSVHRVLLVHFHFPPDGLVGAQITAKFAKYLPDFGWEPFVLTGKERYYTHMDLTTTQDVRRWDRVWRTRSIPHPRYGYLALKALFRARGRNGSPLENSLATTDRRSSLRRTLRSLITVPDDLTGWIPPAVLAGVLLIKQNQIDRLFSSGPPWTNHLVAYALKRLTGVPWAACFEDPWTQTMTTAALDEVSALSVRLHRWLERAVVGRADAVICLNEFHRAGMIAQFSDLPPGKFVVIPNGYDPDDFAMLEQVPESPPTDRFVVTHTGTIYRNRAPRHLFMAVQRLIKDGVVSADKLSLQFIGTCLMGEGQSVQKMAEEHGLGGAVRVSPPLPRAEVIRAMARSHLLLVLAHDWVLQIPAKTYQYLWVGRPILALAPEGATADLIRRSGAGVVVDPYDVDGIAAQLERYVARFRKGWSFKVGDPEVVARFDRRRLTEALACLLKGLDGSRDFTMATAEVAGREPSGG